MRKKKKTCYILLGNDYGYGYEETIEVDTIKEAKQFIYKKYSTKIDNYFYDKNMKGYTFHVNETKEMLLKRLEQ